MNWLAYISYIIHCSISLCRLVVYIFQIYALSLVVTVRGLRDLASTSLIPAATVGLLWDPRRHKRHEGVPVEAVRGATGSRLTGWAGRQPGGIRHVPPFKPRPECCWKPMSISQVFTTQHFHASREVTTEEFSNLIFDSYLSGSDLFLFLIKQRPQTNCSECVSCGDGLAGVIPVIRPGPNIIEDWNCKVTPVRLG